MTYLEAYNADEGIRWRDLLTSDHLRQRIVEKKEQVEWSKSELYPHPLKRIVSVKKPLLERVKNFLLKFIP